ncbi:motility associated factor glycosyltransferase family protein [Acetomicrobium hydrogeniformans]|uniref:6-hydroxymethylpterin diphosphokinase MptE-like domain-containing protein n=1 Tax=Acetomicrobium hydrogeniformans ATCC BAA-1850 TaxID=592015 RepID=A0A0T5XBZ0_9BACT|nr:6-hydroxymethylpterin diphosphokinase MptE-like protein [Acetomicrobium hydrogeniformans]KRT35865.1 hypothetical protein HMPREF1705_03120 [Acetomicrobium hydrogeniformans ATCC BAA-1850]
MSLSIWQENIEELKKRQPKLAALLEKERKSYIESRTRLIPDITQTPSGLWIKSPNRPFFEPFKGNNAKDVPKNACLFVVGAGSPSYFTALFKSMSWSAMAVIVVEPNIDLLFWLFEEVSVYKLLPPFIRLGFAISDEDDLVLELLDTTVTPLGTFTAGDLGYVIHKGECEDPKPFNEILAKLKERILINLQMIGNSVEDTLLGLRQMALSSPWIAFGPKLRTLKGAFKGRPSVVVSAGPSLDKNFHLLKGREDRLLIIATDTVLRKLLKNGIRPHIVCALERGLAVLDKHFRDVIRDYEEELKDVLLIVQSVCVPQIVGTWPGPKIVVGKAGLPLDYWVVGQLLDGDVIPSGASVAHMCMNIAALLGSDKIALIGQDLAYGEEGTTHSSDTAWSKEKSGDAMISEENRIPVPGALGGSVFTHGIWLMFLRIFEQMIGSLAEGGLRVYDCTEGGALIRGTEVMSFKDFTDGFVDSIEGLPILPQEVVIQDTDKDWRGLADSLLKNIDDGIKGFAFSLELLQKLEEEKKRVVSPGLPPARRQKLAYETSAVIDALHAQNRVLEFLGQTYAYATLLEIVKTRTLENMEMITRWEKAHDDLIAAHRVAANFTIQWLTYIKDTIQGFKEAGEKGLSFGLAPADEEAARGCLESLLESNTDDEGDMGRFRKPLIDNLLARCDPLSADWPYKLLWKLALHLESEGRAEEGCAYMQKIAGLLEDREVERTESAGVLKTWARLLAAPDLCRLPQFEMARLILSNALRYAPNDEEIQKMWVFLIEQEGQLFGDLKGLDPENAVIKWRKEKADVEKFVIRGEMYEALHKAWHMVEMFHEVLPNESREIAHWCLSTAEKLLDIRAEASAELTSLMRRVRNGLPIIEELKVPVTPKLAQKIYPGYELKFLPTKAE